MEKNQTRIHTKGFTLIELLVVISIIGFLATTVLASVNSARAKARDARRLADLEQIQTALQLYYDDNGSYPPVTYGPGGSLAGWEVSFLDPSQFLNQLLPYIPRVPIDPTNVGNLPINMFFSPRPNDANFFICIIIMFQARLMDAHGVVLLWWLGFVQRRKWMPQSFIRRNVGPRLRRVQTVGLPMSAAIGQMSLIILFFWCGDYWDIHILFLF